MKANSMLNKIIGYINETQMQGITNCVVLNIIKEVVGYVIAIIKFNNRSASNVCIMKAWDETKIAPNQSENLNDGNQTISTLSKFENIQLATLIKREQDRDKLIRHPSFTKLLNFDIPMEIEMDEDQKFHMLFIHYIPGCSLHEYIFTNQDKFLLLMDDTQILIIIYGIANAMKFMHSKKLNHRDLNPKNIILNCNLCPIICDFETAKGPNNNCTNSGTVGYVAKEVFDPPAGYDESKRDSFAFGVILYDLIIRHDPNKFCTDDGTIMAPVGHSNNNPFFRRIFKSDGVLQKLYENCVDDVWKSRPSFEVICDILKKFVNESCDDYKIDKIRFNEYVEFMNEWEAKDLNDPYLLMSFDEQLNQAVKFQMIRALNVFAAINAKQKYLIENIINEISRKYVSFMTIIIFND